MFDLLVISFIASAIVAASWDGHRSSSSKGRAILTLGALANLAVAEFAHAYWSISQLDSDGFSEPLNRADAAYLSVNRFTMIGGDDILAVSGGARIVAAAQTGAAVLFLGVAVVSVVSANIRSGADRSEESVD